MGAVSTFYARSLGDFLALVTVTALGAGRTLFRISHSPDRRPAPTPPDD